MTTQIAIRLDDEEIAALDDRVAQGLAATRSEAVRQAIAGLRRDRRYREEDSVLQELARRGESVYPELQGLLEHAHPELD